MEDKTMINYHLVTMIDDVIGVTATLREAYADRYPTDSAMISDIPKELKLHWIWLALAHGVEDKTEELCRHDSIVREAAFGAISHKTGLPYDFFYYLWIGDEAKAFETLYSDNPTGKFREVTDEEMRNTDD